MPAAPTPRRALHGTLLAILLAGCAGAPPPPDWKLDAHAALETHARHYLNGDTRLADLGYARARAEIARTGRLDLAARAELHRCAVRVAALDFSTCEGYADLAAHAGAEDRAYARFLIGEWDALDPRQLPAWYADLLNARDPAGQLSAIQALQDPLSRCIAAGVLFRTGQTSPAVIALAIGTASEQGWRRPLLAWLEVQARRAEASGDQQGLETIRRRRALIESSMP
jgi:hypothetical protein